MLFFFNCFTKLIKYIHRYIYRHLIIGINIIGNKIIFKWRTVIVLICK